MTRVAADPGVARAGPLAGRRKQVGAGQRHQWEEDHGANSKNSRKKSSNKVIITCAVTGPAIHTPVHVRRICR